MNKNNVIFEMLLKLFHFKNYPCVKFMIYMYCSFHDIHVLTSTCIHIWIYISYIDCFCLKVLQNLIEMGFDEKDALEALRISRNNQNDAVS